MITSRLGKWVVAMASGIGIVIGAWNALRGLISNLNGWHVLLALSSITLLILAADQYHQSMEKRFVSILKFIDDLSKELSRATGALSAQCDYRIGNIAQDFETKIKKEADSRIGGWDTDRSRINDLATRLKNLELNASSAANA